jgi:hypothetical protein
MDMIYKQTLARRLLVQPPSYECFAAQKLEAVKVR